MYSLNRAQMIGNVTREVEMRQLPSGVAVASFSVATNQVWTDPQGVRQEKAEFHDVVAWRKLAEIAGQMIKKGTRVFVEGRMQTREWTGEDGVKRRKTEIVAENLIILDRKSADSTGDFEMNADRARGVFEDKKDSASAPAGVKEEEVVIDDLPF